MRNKIVEQMRRGNEKTQNQSEKSVKNRIGRHVEVELSPSFFLFWYLNNLGCERIIRLWGKREKWDSKRWKIGLFASLSSERSIPLSTFWLKFFLSMGALLFWNQRELWLLFYIYIYIWCFGPSSLKLTGIHLTSWKSTRCRSVIIHALCMGLILLIL